MPRTLPALARPVLALAAALTITLAGPLAAGAAYADELDPLLSYEGPGTVTSEGDSRITDLTLSIDCSRIPCLLSGTIIADGAAYPLLPAPAEIPGDHLEVAIPATGDPCGEDYINSGNLTIDFRRGALSGTRTADGTGEIDCADGSVLYHAGVLEFEATLVSGSDCLLLGGCATPEPTPASSAAAPASDTTAGATTPSTLSTLATVGEALRPANALWAVAGALVLVILVALPSHLLTTALEGASDRLAERLRRGRQLDERLARALTGWPLAAGAVAAAALISAFIDPGFGFTLHGLRVLLSIGIAFALEVVVGWTVLTLLVRRRRPDITASYKVIPLGLLAVIGAVLFSRLTGFEPGLVYGVVAGVVFAGIAERADQARLTLITLGYAFTIGILAWVVYSVTPSDGGPALLFVRETLSALAIGGIVALPIALLPIPGLAGSDLFRWRRPVWAAAYALGLAAFLLVLMPLPASWDTVGVALPAWIGVIVAYAVVATGLWLALARPWGREGDASQAES